MPRVKRGTSHVKRRRTLLKKVKGYKWGRKKLIRLAKTAVNKAGQHAFADRKKKKGDFRKLWNIKINAGVREEGLSYSAFIKKLKDNKVELDRKILADLAENNSKVFKEVVNKVK
jgi:large subunit ribosomal protein L20